MGLLGLFFKFSLGCFDILAWPLIALGYPLYASIQAIETDSNPDTQRLITYWVCFSLILLFEHAFLKLLLWLPSWTYIKLVIVGYLVAPKFDGSFYVYKHLVRPCLSIDLYMELKKFFNQDYLKVEVNSYVKETEAESLENLIAFKPDFEEPKGVQKDYNVLEITEKKELPSTNRVEHINLALSENRTCEPLDINEIIAAMVTSGDLPAVAPSENVQKEWTCALCQVTTSCEAILISHLNGRRHADACEKLKAKDQSLKSKVSLVSSETDKSLEIKEMANTEVGVRDASGNSYLKSTLNPWTCALCQVVASSKTNLVSHFQGKRHVQALENLKNKILTSKTWIFSDSVETGDPIENKEQMTTVVATASQVNAQNPWICSLCGTKIYAETTLFSHLQGKRHQQACERHKAKIQMLKQ